MSVDLVELFTEIGVRHWTSGKNVSLGWIGIRCVYCNDSSNHLGVSLQKGNFSCWKCGSTGSLKELLMEMGYPYRDAMGLIQKHSSDTQQLAQRRVPGAGAIDLTGFVEDFSDLQRRYLINRGFSPDELQQKYFLMGGHHIKGDWKFRIIVPVIMRGEIVNFTGMAVAGQEPKYKHCPDDQSVMTIKQTLYNYDNVKGFVIGICEGVTDVWRMGDGFVATFGTKFTDDQVQLILQKRISRVLIMYDADAPREADRLAHQLASFCHLEVFAAKLPSGDPADLKINEVSSIRKDLGFD